MVSASAVGGRRRCARASGRLAGRGNASGRTMYSKLSQILTTSRHGSRSAIERPPLARGRRWGGAVPICWPKAEPGARRTHFSGRLMSGKRKASALDAALAKFQKVQQSAAQIQIDAANTREKSSAGAKAERLKAMAEAEAAERRVRASPSILPNVK